MSHRRGSRGGNWIHRTGPGLRRFRTPWRTSPTQINKKESHPSSLQASLAFIRRGCCPATTWELFALPLLSISLSPPATRTVGVANCLFSDAILPDLPALFKPCGSFPHVLFPFFPVFNLSNIAGVAAKCSACIAEYWCGLGCLFKLAYRRVFACCSRLTRGRLYFYCKLKHQYLKTLHFLLLFQADLIKVDPALANASAGKHLI